MKLRERQIQTSEHLATWHTQHIARSCTENLVNFWRFTDVQQLNSVKCTAVGTCNIWNSGVCMAQHFITADMSPK